MAPRVPEEIDVFTIPHSRMKELVNTYTQKVQCADFRNFQETLALLMELQSTLYEFKSHEKIENFFIMDQLKNRLKLNQINNAAVCECHNDNKLSKVQKLVKHGKLLQQNSSVVERLDFGEALQRSFLDFVQQFLPHMAEEEEVFQPLLVEYFDYDELCVIKEVVLEQHELVREAPFGEEKADDDVPEVAADVKDRWDADVEIEQGAVSEIEDLAPSLPVELLSKIFGLLSPRDLARCAGVCSMWNDVVFSTPNWKNIFPIQWFKGIWSWSDENLTFAFEDELEREGGALRLVSKCDEDADKDETEADDEEGTEGRDMRDFFDDILTHLLPRIGDRVEQLVLDAGVALSSRQVGRALALCPRLRVFSAAYTNVDYYTFKGLYEFGCLSQLQHIDLQGCTRVDDTCLFALAQCLALGRQNVRSCCRGGETNLACGVSTNFSHNRYNVRPQYSTSRNDYRGSGEEFIGCCGASPSCEGCVYNRGYQQNCAVECPMRRHKEIVAYDELSWGEDTNLSGLEHLNLSGCFEVSAEGLEALLRAGALRGLRSLNVSSCLEVDGVALKAVVYACPLLRPEQLCYCDRIEDGPYPNEANGCDNLSHPVKYCCRSRLDL